jgi:hypothetical protein
VVAEIRVQANQEWEQNEETRNRKQSAAINQGRRIRTQALIGDAGFFQSRESKVCCMLHHCNFADAIIKDAANSTQGCHGSGARDGSAQQVGNASYAARERREGSRFGRLRSAVG